MTLNPVESSNVARLGFADGIMRVQFRNGHIYDYPASEKEYLALLAAPSKGRWIAANLKARQSTAREKSPEPGAVAGNAQAVLQTHTPDACCTRHIIKALRFGALDTAREWTCPRCEQLWKVSEVNGVRHWEPDVAVMVLRL